MATLCKMPTNPYLHIFHICVHGFPVAALKINSVTNASRIEYFSKDTPAFSPLVVNNGEPILHNGFPPFLAPLLPSAARAMEIGKRLGFEPEDKLERIRHSLGTYNAGHITVVPAVETLASSRGGFPFDGLSTTVPGPPVFTFSSFETLANKEIHTTLITEIAKTSGATGIGGNFNKCFCRNTHDEFIIKSYPDTFTQATSTEVAAMEEACSVAARAAGVPAAETFAYGPFVLSKRFDKGLRLHHARDFLNVKDQYDGSYEQVFKKTDFQNKEELLKQIIFSWTCGDSDKHLENMAFLEKDIGKYYLSPAYDICPSRFISGDAEELALTLNGRKARITLQDFVVLGKKASMSKTEVMASLKASVEACKKHFLPVCPPAVAKVLSDHLEIANVMSEGGERREAEILCLQRGLEKQL